MTTKEAITLLEQKDWKGLAKAYNESWEDWAAEQWKEFAEHIRRGARGEVLERIADVPRILIIHKDKSKSPAILEHSLETHGLLKKND